MDSSVWYFLIIMGACTLFFVLGLISGEHEHSDVGSVHDMGFGHDTFLDHGADVHGGHEHIHEGVHGDEGNTNNGFREIFSIRNLMMFGIGFGAAGAASEALGAGLWLAIPFAIIIGFLVAYVGMVALRFVMSQESSTDSSLTSLLGETGTVTTTVSKNGSGEAVLSNFRGEQVHLIVRSEDGSEIQEGTQVQLVSLDGGHMGVVRDTKKIPSGSSW